MTHSAPYVAGCSCQRCERNRVVSRDGKARRMAETAEFRDAARQLAAAARRAEQLAAPGRAHPWAVVWLTEARERVERIGQMLHIPLMPDVPPADGRRRARREP